jgi:4-hydroxyphenylacetate 3-monooxygenase
MLGEIWCYAELVRAASRAAEADARDYGSGVWLCDDRPFRALRSLVPGYMVRAAEILKLLGAHNLLATPAAAAFEHPRLGPLLERYLPGANGLSARERAILFRTAWDFVGSALGGRSELYERFYLASAARTLAIHHQLAQREKKATALPELLARSRS